MSVPMVHLFWTINKQNHTVKRFEEINYYVDIFNKKMNIIDALLKLQNAKTTLFRLWHINEIHCNIKSKGIVVHISYVDF